MGVLLGVCVAVQPLSAQRAPAAADTVLQRLVTVSLQDVSIGEALLVLRHRHGVPLAWSGDIIPAERRVTLHAAAMPLHQVLGHVLDGSMLRVVITGQGTVVVVPAIARVPALPTPGRDADTGVPDIARGLRATGVQQLDQVVVMGSTVTGGPEREQPTAVRVIGTARLSEVSAPRLTDALRLTLPGLVLWDRGPTGPPPSFAAVRGMASFTTRAIKTYIDGIEVASPELFTLLDGRSIEQVEMIRGPQGAALYGPDALNGILQIRTRHGRPGTNAWVPRWFVGGGTYEREDLSGAQPVYDLSGGVSASTSRASLDFSGSLAGAGRDSATREMRSWNLQTGATAVLGSVLVDASARIAEYEFAASRIAAAVRSPQIPQQVRERAVAFTMTQQVTERFRHALIAGGHWISGDREPFRSPLLPPRLPAGASFEQAERLSVRYANTLIVSPALEVSSGAEYSARTADRERVRSTLLFDLSSLYQNTLRSTGAFAQTRLRIGPQLTLSGGVRGEQLSSVSPRQGTVWASTAGLSYTQSLGPNTLRWRSAWGRGIRPPEPGMVVARSTGVLRQFPNPNLAPERQDGVELGVDVFTADGAFFKATWYTQTASGLFQQVTRLPGVTVPDAYQFQNVGVISNRGIEVDAGWQRGWQRGLLTTGLSVHVPRSRVQSLSPSYTGELRPGDAMIEVPEASGAAYVRWHSRVPPRATERWTVEVGTTMLGPWTGYDWQLLARIERGQATRRDLVRDYWLRYDGIVRPYVTASLRLRAQHHLSLRVDNPANTSAFIRDNATAPLGRVVTVGIERRGR